MPKLIYTTPERLDAFRSYELPVRRKPIASYLLFLKLRTFLPALFHYAQPMKIIALLSFLIVMGSYVASAQVSVSQVFTEARENPVGLDQKRPRFSWQLASDQRNVMQTAYELRVGANSTRLLQGDSLVWNSGPVNSDSSAYVSYAGEPLQSGQRYYWQVRITDNKGNTSAWSDPAYWQMGLLEPTTEFQAQWIGPGYTEDSVRRRSPYFRKTFSVPTNKQVRSATVHLTAHGLYEAYLNGQRIGNAYLTPGWTSYDHRLQYQTYDVTDQLQTGDNALGAVLGSGWYRSYLGFQGQKNLYGDDVALLCQLDIRYEDGSTESIRSDSSWKSSTGPILDSEIYRGEHYDARAEMPGWHQADYDDTTWQSVTTHNYDKDILLATYNEPIRKQETFQPQAIFTTPAGERVADFGQNLVGWVQLTVQGSEGDSITLHHAEVLDKEGNFYTANLRSAKQRNIYVLRGGEPEIFEPHFTFQGFRYVKIDGFPGELRPENLTAVALYSDMRPTGEFATSDSLLNQLQHNIQWGQKGNFLDVPTDCPQRDERLGWTGDAQAFFRTAAYNMNVHNFFVKWMEDVSAEQLPSGSVPFVVPNVLGKEAAGSAGWADVATIIPWEMYRLYGDRQALTQQYETMKQWVNYMRDQSQNDLWQSGFHFGDWLFYRPDDDNSGRAAVTDKYLIAQCFFAHSTQYLVNAAQALGIREDVTEYTDLLGRVKDAYQREYLTPSGRLVSGTQTAYVLALYFDMLPEALRAQAADRLVANISDYDNHLTTGFLGTPYLCHVLSRFGHTDVAYQLLMQKTYPSWLYPVTMGATTIWERWDGIKPDSTFQTPSMNSYNHYAYGAIGDWMYRNIAGLNASDSALAYRQSVIKPILGGGLDEGSGSFRTNYGPLASHWQITDVGLTLEVTIPVNTTADVYVPADSKNSVTESGTPVAEVAGIDVVGQAGDYLHLKMGSGTYQFASSGINGPVTKGNDDAGE